MEKAEEKYRQLGMTEEQIKALYKFECETFNSNRRFYENTVELSDINTYNEPQMSRTVPIDLKRNWTERTGTDHVINCICAETERIYTGIPVGTVAVVVFTIRSNSYASDLKILYRILPEFAIVFFKSAYIYQKTDCFFRYVML